MQYFSGHILLGFSSTYLFIYLHLGMANVAHKFAPQKRQQSGCHLLACIFLQQQVHGSQSVNLHKNAISLMPGCMHVDLK